MIHKPKISFQKFPSDTKAGTFFLCILTILKMWKKSSCLCSGLLRCFKWWKMNLWISSTAFAKFTMSFFATCFFKLSQNSGNVAVVTNLRNLWRFFYSFGNMVEDSKFSFPFVPKSFKSTLILSGRSWLSSGCFAWNTRRDDAGKMQDTKMKRCKGAKMPNFLVLNAPTRWIHHSLKMSWNDLIDHFPISSIREGFHVQMFPKYKHCLNFWPCLITRLREFIYISSRHDASISWSPVHNTLEFHYCSLHWSFVFEEVLKWRHRGEICFDSAASFSTREASFVSLNLVLWTCIADFLCFFPCFLHIVSGSFRMRQHKMLIHATASRFCLIMFWSCASSGSFQQKDLPNYRRHKSMELRTPSSISSSS